MHICCNTIILSFYTATQVPAWVQGLLFHDVAYMTWDAIGRIISRISLADTTQKAYYWPDADSQSDYWFITS